MCLMTSSFASIVTSSYTSPYTGVTCSCYAFNSYISEYLSPEIYNPYIVRVLGEELESGESSDCYTIHLILGGINLGNDDIIVVFEVLSKIIPDGGQLLAVATPWSIWEEVGGKKEEGGGGGKGGR